MYLITHIEKGKNGFQSRGRGNPQVYIRGNPQVYIGGNPQVYIGEILRCTLIVINSKKTETCYCASFELPLPVRYGLSM